MSRFLDLEENRIFGKKSHCQENLEMLALLVGSKAISLNVNSY